MWRENSDDGGNYGNLVGEEVIDVKMSRAYFSYSAHFSSFSILSSFLYERSL